MSGNTDETTDAPFTNQATQADIDAAFSGSRNDATGLFDGVPQDASESDVKAALEALELSHETDTQYSGSFDDFSVPSEVAEVTGIEDISEFDGFTHRGEVLSLPETIDELRHQLYFEHSHHGQLPVPQTAITAHAAADRIATALEKQFESWMTPQPDLTDETADKAVDASDIYFNCLNLERFEKREVYYCLARGGCQSRSTKTLC